MSKSSYIMFIDSLCLILFLAFISFSLTFFFNFAKRKVVSLVSLSRSRDLFLIFSFSSVPPRASALSLLIDGVGGGGGWRENRGGDWSTFPPPVDERMSVRERMKMFEKLGKKSPARAPVRRKTPAAQGSGVSSPKASPASPAPKDTSGSVSGKKAPAGKPAGQVSGVSSPKSSPASPASPASPVSATPKDASGPGGDLAAGSESLGRAVSFRKHESSDDEDWGEDATLSGDDGDNDTAEPQLLPTSSERALPATDKPTSTSPAAESNTKTRAKSSKLANFLSATSSSGNTLSMSRAASFQRHDSSDDEVWEEETPSSGTTRMSPSAPNASGNPACPTPPAQDNGDSSSGSGGGSAGNP